MFALRRTALVSTIRLPVGSGARSSLSSLVSVAAPDGNLIEHQQQQHQQQQQSLSISELAVSHSSNVLSMVSLAAARQWSYWWNGSCNTSVSLAPPSAATNATTAVTAEKFLLDTILDNTGIYLISTLKRRRKMMNKHKLRKRRKKNRMKNKK
eukprot:jgi/Psemu1/304450/fgenesh1_kg.153_\